MTSVNLLSDKLYYRGTELLNPHHATVGPGLVAVIGPNGAGKSTLGEILVRGWNFRTNRITSDTDKPRIRKIEFNDIHTLAGASVEYYQQRYESSMNDEVPTVREVFGERTASAEWFRLAVLFNLRDVADMKVNYLSSGELRKVLVINALTEPTDMLVLDNPYIGLDAPSRVVLDKALEALRRDGLTVVLLVTDPDDIPDATDSVIPVRSMTIGAPVPTGGNIKAVRESMYSLFDFAIDLSALPPAPATVHDPVDIVLQLEDCTVSYGESTILDHLDWTVRDRECWALSGPNGSGKSTLLSLVTADNPKAYSNRVTVFDRRRGTGETIWDVKRNIGYLSPEMNLHFNGVVDVLTLVAQGLNDTSGMFAPLSEGQKRLAADWLSLFHLMPLHDRPFNTLSSGEKQMVLLARTFIKQPRLLILDEPMHSLDYARARAVRALVNHLAARSAAQPERYPMTLIFVSHYLRELPECITHTKTLPNRFTDDSD